MPESQVEGADTEQEKNSKAPTTKEQLETHNELREKIRIGFKT